MQDSRDVAGMASLSRPEREAWVQMKLVAAFMRHARPALHGSTVGAAVVFLLLYDEVSANGLGLWGVGMGALALVRYRILSVYRRTMRGVSGAKLENFMSRNLWVWTLNAMLWGSLAFIFFLQAPIYHQFICMTVLVALPGFSVGTFSSYLRGFTHYVDGLMAILISALIFVVVRTNREQPGLDTWGMIVLAFIYWAVIRTSGKRIHAVQRANLELQFDNEALVISLTEKSRAALEAVDVKNRFIASAAHDMRQPVHALALYASWLASEPALVREITPKIVRSTRAVNDLFDSLFDFVGLESGTLSVRPEAVDLLALLQDLHLQYEPIARERNLRLQLRARSLRFRTDPVLLKRLLGNLISNAVKNTYIGGVLIALRRRRGRWAVEIWDTGAGIAREHQQAVFQEFYRVPQAGTDEGFGLGLAIVSRLARALQHPVGMVSRPGRGSVFWLELDEPLSDDPS